CEVSPITKRKTFRAVLKISLRIGSFEAFKSEIRLSINTLLELVEATFSSRATASFCSFFIGDRKSTRLNSSHVKISYAVFCLKKKKITYLQLQRRGGRPCQRCTLR